MRWLRPYGQKYSESLEYKQKMIEKLIRPFARLIKLSEWMSRIFIVTKFMPLWVATERAISTPELTRREATK